MVQTCSAFGCKKRATPENVANGLHFHRFPTDEVIGKQWILATRKVDFQPSKHSRLCSDHFGIEDYYVQNDGAFRLNKDAVPSVFEGLPKHLQKSLKPKRKPHKERSNIPAKIAKMASSISNIAAALQKGPATGLSLSLFFVLGLLYKIVPGEDSKLENRGLFST